MTEYYMVKKSNNVGLPIGAIFQKNQMTTTFVEKNIDIFHKCDGSVIPYKYEKLKKTIRVDRYPSFEIWTGE